LGIALIVAGFAFSLLIVIIYLYRELRTRSNLGEFDAYTTCLQIVQSAKKTLRIVTDFTPKIFEDSQMLFVFHVALEKGVTTKILHDPAIGFEKIPKFKKLVDESDGKIVVRKMKSKPTHHFWVADDVNLRLEYPHPLGDITNVSAGIRYNTLEIGYRYSREFD
jgi:hypothetical protein